MLNALPRTGLTRRTLLTASALALTPARRLLAQGAARTSTHLSLAEPPKFWSDPPAIIAKRFALYRAAGVGTLRCSVHWDGMQGADGKWHLPGNINYLRQARQAGFALKLVVSTMGSIPEWFMRQHPGMLIRDQNGETTHLSLSYWHPDLPAVLNRALSGMCETLAGQNILDSSSFFIVDLGAAAEAKYPSAWNMHKTQNKALFWCYDNQAAASFSAAMQQKYGTINVANAAWGSHFSSWSDVTPPKPGLKTGPIWHDMLTWYRNGKRSFTTAQIARYQAALKPYGISSSRLVVLLPGNHLTTQQWQSADSGLHETVEVGTMIDSAFTIDSAANAGCMLQYTGAQNAHEVAWVRQYLTQKGYSTPLWGENAGQARNKANNPLRLTQIAQTYGLYGVEYINAGYLFLPDRITPTNWFADFSRAYQAILGHLPPT